MYSIINKYMNSLTKENVNTFAKKNNIILSESELEFTYNFVKKNWEKLLSNPSLLNLEHYKDKYSIENYQKITKLFKEYYQKYGHLI